MQNQEQRHQRLAVNVLVGGKDVINREECNTPESAGNSRMHPINSNRSSRRVVTSNNASRNQRALPQPILELHKKSSAVTTGSTGKAKHYVTYEQRQQHIMEMYSRGTFNAKRPSAVTMQSSLQTTGKSKVVLNNKRTASEVNSNSQSFWGYSSPPNNAVQNGVKSMFSNALVSDGEAKFSKDFTKMVLPSSSKRRTQKVNRQIFEEVQRNLPIYSQQAKTISRAVKHNRPRNYTSQGYRTSNGRNAVIQSHESQIQFNPSASIPQTEGGYRSMNETSPPSIQQVALYNQQVQNKNTGVLIPSAEMRSVSSSRGDTQNISKINSRMQVSSRINRLGSTKSTIMNQKLASNQSNMLGSANTRDMRAKLCTPVDDEPLEELLNGFYSNKKPPGTATGIRRPRISTAIHTGDIDEDLQAEKLSLAPFVKKDSHASNMFRSKQQQDERDNCLLFTEAESNKLKWKSKPLIHLIDLTHELELNFDMFEHSDGKGRLNDPILTRTELDRHKLANWAYRMHTDLLELRDLEYPDAKLPTTLQEATWILRSCMIAFKEDDHMISVVANLWKTIITLVDVELTNLHKMLENHEDRIWDAAKKKYQIQFNSYDDQIMTLERINDENQTEIERLSKINKESSGVENRLNHAITDLLNFIENMKNPRDFSKFKMELMQCIQVMEGLESNKEFQLGLQRKSLQLMRKNLKQPDKIIYHVDGTTEEINHEKDQDFDESQFADWNNDKPKNGEIIYNNIYGMNPAYGSSPYDIEDVAFKANRYTEVIHKAVVGHNQEIFNSMVGQKLTFDEIKKFESQIAQELTPLIDAQVRSQCADEMKKIIIAHRSKLFAKFFKKKCKNCGKNSADKGDDLLDELESDSDIEVLLKGMKAGADMMDKKKNVTKIRRPRERENSDSDYDIKVNAMTGETRKVKKKEEDLYEIDVVTGKAIVDLQTGKKVRNSKRAKRKDHYSTGESSYADEDIYQVDTKTGKFIRDKKTGALLRKAEADMYEIDTRTGRPKIDPATGKKIRRYDSDNYMKDSDGEVKIDSITGRKIRRRRLNLDDYEQDAFGAPKLDDNGRPIKKKKPLTRRNHKGELIGDSETEYEVDIITGKPRINPKTGWPVPITKIKRKKGFTEDDYMIDNRTGKVMVDAKSGRPVRKQPATKKDRKGRLIEESDETEYEIDSETGKPLIDPTTGWPVPKYELDPLTGAHKICPRTGRKIVSKRKVKRLQDSETEYEVDEKGNPKVDPITRRPIAKYVIDPKTGKRAIDPATGKHIKIRKKFQSEGETDYEIDEKTGKVKLDSDGKPVAKLMLDLNGKVKIDSKTGKPMTRRIHKKDKGNDEAEGSSYEVDWKNGKYVLDPSTGQPLIDSKSGRKWKVIRKGANKEYESDEYDRKRKIKKGEKGEPEELSAVGMRNLSSKINANLGKAAISKNAAIKKQTIKEMKNPIMEAIEKTLGVGKKKLGKEYFIAMKSPQMFEIMDNMMCEKALHDLKSEQNPIKDRRITPYATFMYDSMLMQYGLPQLAVKVLFQLTNGIRSIKDENPFALLLNQMLGMDDRPLRLDEIGIVLRSHLFFKIQQDHWLNRIKGDGRIHFNPDSISNLKNGGEMCIFDLIEELKIALKHDKEISERILTQIKPDCLLVKQENRKQLSQEFAVLKVAFRVARMGKDPTWIFQEIDYDKSGTLSPQEILQGCRNVLGVYFSTEEANLFTSYLDEDSSGDVDLEEFTDKVNLDNLQQKIHKFLISECTFIEKMLNEWYFVQKREKKEVLEVVKKFDENGDGVFQLNEFKHMMKALEPEIDDKKIMTLFKTSLSITSNGVLNDAINQEVLFMTFTKYKISGFGKGFFNQYLTERMDKIKADRRKKK